MPTELEKTAGKPLVALSSSHQRVLKDVVRDSHPEERWLAIPEIAPMKFLRDLFPNLSTHGLSEDDRETLRLAAAVRNLDASSHSLKHKPKEEQ
jgi:hypothetical protein